jgi:hypothetical protein
MEMKVQKRDAFDSTLNVLREQMATIKQNKNPFKWMMWILMK